MQRVSSRQVIDPIDAQANVADRYQLADSKVFKIRAIARDFVKVSAEMK